MPALRQDSNVQNGVQVTNVVASLEAEIPNVQNGGHVTGCELDDLSISGQLLQGKGWLASRVNSVSWLQPGTKNYFFKICQLRRNKRHFVYSVLSAFTLT